MPVGVLKFSLWNVNVFFPVSYLNPLMRVYYICMIMPTSVPLPSVIKEAGLRPLHSIVAERKFLSPLFHLCLLG